MPYLIQDLGTINERVFKLKPGLNTIGRMEDNTIVVEDHERSISRYHADITITSDRVALCDLKSSNGTFVNNTKITQCELKDGDLIRCGHTLVFKFVNCLNIDEQQAGAPENNLSILTKVSPEQNRIFMQDLLQNNNKYGSVLKLRQQDTDLRTVDKLKILLEVSKQLSSPNEYDQLLEKILDLLFTIMNVDRAVILMLNEATGQLEPKAFKAKTGINGNLNFYSKRIANFVLQKGDAILSADAGIDARFNNSESILQQAIRASMCVPFKPREKVIGILYTDNLSMSNVYSQEDLEFMTALANQAAIAIDNANLYKKMQAEAEIRHRFECFFPTSVSKKLKEEGNLEIIDTEVTALFADISNFTEMSSTMEPRQVIEMLNEYFTVMVEDIVFRYEGTLEKYIGDALLAVWGAPYQQPDDIQRAVKAAIEMQWAVLALNEIWRQRQKLPIQIHIGINTGKVAAGNIGSEKLIQYATIGDATNVTSRICNAAQAGEILISQTTFDKLYEPNLPIEKLPETTKVKGKDEPLQLYRVLWHRTQPVDLHIKATNRINL